MKRKVKSIAKIPLDKRPETTECFIVGFYRDFDGEVRPLLAGPAEELFFFFVCLTEAKRTSISERFTILRKTNVFTVEKSPLPIPPHAFRFTVRYQIDESENNINTIILSSTRNVAFSAFCLRYSSNTYAIILLYAYI